MRLQRCHHGGIHSSLRCQHTDLTARKGEANVMQHGVDAVRAPLSVEHYPHILADHPALVACERSTTCRNRRPKPPLVPRGPVAQRAVIAAGRVGTRRLGQDVVHCPGGAGRDRVRRPHGMNR